MKKIHKLTVGIYVLIIGVLLLGTDRLFVSADSGNYYQSVTILTAVAMVFILVGAIWLFKSAFK